MIVIVTLGFDSRHIGNVFQTTWEGEGGGGGGDGRGRSEREDTNAAAEKLLVMRQEEGDTKLFARTLEADPKALRRGSARSDGSRA